MGAISSTELHAHNAVQCCIALQGLMQVKWAKRWFNCSAVVINSNQLHSIASADGLVCLLYLEKNSPQSVSVMNSFQKKRNGLLSQQPFLIDTKIPKSLLKATSIFRDASNLSKYPDADQIAQANTLMAECLQFFRSDVSQKLIIDQRVLETVDFIKMNLETRFSGQSLAQRVGLSESRMQHLFKENVGIPVRRYILWARLKAVILYSVNGFSLTDAAHSAGFSDSAHFSRTFKATFGIKASTLLNSSNQLNTIFCD